MSWICFDTYIYVDRLKSFESQYKDDITHQNHSCTTIVHALKDKNYAIKIVAILDIQLLFDKHLCQSMLVFL